MRPIITLVVIVVLGVAQSAAADKASTYYHKAMAHKQAGDRAAAIGALKSALQHRDGYAAAHRSLGILYRQAGDQNKAIFHLERATELEPKAADGHYSLGLAYHRAGHKQKALTALEKAAKLKPNDQRIVAQLGVMLIRVNPERAIPYLKRAVKLEPQSRDNLHQLGLAYRKAAGRLTGDKVGWQAISIHERGREVFGARIGLWRNSRPPFRSRRVVSSFGKGRAFDFSLREGRRTRSQTSARLVGLGPYVRQARSIQGCG